MQNNLVRVFEHQTLHIGEQGLTQSIFKQLVRYNDLHGCKYFDVGYNRIRFKNYVGVIQAGPLVIEILPKADASQKPDQQKWRNALIKMLHRSGLLKLDSLTEANLKLRHATLFDLYLESFLSEVKTLIHQGLFRKYRRKEGNLPYLKGKLLLSRHLSNNLLHKEQFYTEHTLYDHDNPLNQILKAALNIVSQWPGNQHLRAKANTLLLNFEDISDQTFREPNFTRLRFDRNSERYRSAIQLAKLIILEYLPDIRHGREHVLAILFDMNLLFERYVFAEMKRAERYFSAYQLQISAQKRSKFWGRKTLRPDIVADFHLDGEFKRIILDTKWKSLKIAVPADDDLRQMYAYNLHLGAQKAILLYPKVICGNQEYKNFCSSEILKGYTHGCGLDFVNLFDQDDRLKSDLGSLLIHQLILDN